MDTSHERSVTDVLVKLAHFSDVSDGQCLKFWSGKCTVW